MQFKEIQQRCVLDKYVLFLGITAIETKQNSKICTNEEPCLAIICCNQIDKIDYKLLFKCYNSNCFFFSCFGVLKRYYTYHYLVPCQLVNTNNVLLKACVVNRQINLSPANLYFW